MSAPITSLSSVVLSHDEPSSMLFTVKIMNPRLLDRVSLISSCWSTMVSEKLARTYGLPDPTVERLKALQAISVDLVTHMRLDHFALYVAFDRLKKIQGLALATFGPGLETKIKYLGTHPDNVPLGELQMSVVRGAGTALVRHIAKDVLTTEMSLKSIGLLSKESAAPFYEKLGFKFVTIGTLEMQLLEPGLHHLVEQAARPHAMLEGDGSLLEYVDQLH